jgi:hypothetical protein
MTYRLLVEATRNCYKPAMMSSKKLLLALAVLATIFGTSVVISGLPSLELPAFIQPYDPLP